MSKALAISYTISKDVAVPAPEVCSDYELTWPRDQAVPCGNLHCASRTPRTRGRVPQGWQDARLRPVDRGGLGAHVTRIGPARWVFCRTVLPVTSNGSGPKASETKKERWWSRWWARWLAVAIGERRQSIWKWARRLAVAISLGALGVITYLLGWYVPNMLVRHKADPSVEVAWIGAIATLLGVAATAAVAIFAFWYSRSTNQATIKDQGKQLDKTLKAQRKQTNKTLAAQRQQLNETLAAQREQLDITHTRTLNERFATAAGQLGSDKPAAVRLAGVYAMAGLADDWEESRQTCVDVLCAYLRLPHDPDPGDDADPAERTAYRANREVRHTVIRVIATHLQADAAVSWQGLDFDFASAVFDGGDFRGAVFSGGQVCFRGAVFSGGQVRFGGARFSGGTVDFSEARFSGGEVNFVHAEFSGGQVCFLGAEFSGGMVLFGASFSGGTVDFRVARFSGSEVLFDQAGFSGGEVNFGHAKFSGGRVSFDGAEFSGSKVHFFYARFSGGTVSIIARFSGGTVSFDGAGFFGGRIDFYSAEFSGSKVHFSYARFSGGTVRFDDAKFFRGAVSFSDAKFSGGEVDFSGVEFSGGEVDFSRVGDWSLPPAFDWADTPPPGVKLPNKDQSQA
jgi:uncharacterized protein YjbI with pentapeptide repeats